MPSNLLLFLPLIAGYLFLHTAYRFKYRAKTLEGHRLVIETAVCGFGLLALARFLVVCTSRVDMLGGVRDLLLELTGGVPFLGTGVVSIGAAIPCAFIWNLTSGIWSTRDTWRRRGARTLLLNRRWLLENAQLVALRRALGSSKNEMKELLNRAAEEGSLILLSMRDRKVYAGWVVDSPTPDRNETDLAILPIYSGHRKVDDLRVVLDTPYPYEDEANGLDPEDFIVVLRLADICSARLFDKDVFYRHFVREAQPADTGSGKGSESA